MICHIKKTILAIFFVGLILSDFAVQAQVATPQNTLNQYIVELQKNPNDNALREKIIRLARTIKPPPAITEDARRYLIQGGAYVKSAKSQKGYELAVKEYEKVLLIAPWWPEAYNNYSVALELAGRFDEAVKALNLYILTNPGVKETRYAQDRIYEIDAKNKLAQEEKKELDASERMRAAESKKREEEEKRLQGFEGTWCLESTCKADAYIITRNDRGEYFAKWISGDFCVFTEVKVVGRSLMTKQSCANGSNIQVANDTLSNDGKLLNGTFTIFYPDGRVAQETLRSTSYRK